MSVLADCTRDGLIAASKCFNCLSAKEKEAFKVYFLAQALKSFGGTDLTNLRTLRSTTACLKCEPDFVLDSFMVAIYQKLASVAGSTVVDLPIATLRRLTACNPCGDSKSDRASEVYLLCLLAVLGR